MRKFEVYENNGGGLTLFVWNVSGDEIVFAHSGYEYIHGQLLDDVQSLKDGNEPENWDGNNCYCGDRTLDWEELGKTLDDVYEEERDNSELVADNDGTYPDNMGNSASYELLEEQDN